MNVDTEKLKNFLMEKELTVVELQRLSGISLSTLHLIIKGAVSPSFKTVGKLAKALSIRPSDIIIK